MDAASEAVARWGTWEELVLGGAVLRHGTAAWDAVAVELRARCPYPFLFTPQECEARYEDLKERYSGCDAWFEELRKQRVAELRKELEKSEDSIGSLQSRIESLNAERGSSDNAEYNTSQPESPLPTENADCLNMSSKVSRNGSSAGSYTGETGRDWSQECRISASVSSQGDDMKVDLPENSRKEIGESRGCDVIKGIFRKKRGQRKRKGCTIVKEGSLEESSMASMDRVDPAADCSLDVDAPPEDVKASEKDFGGHVQHKNSSLDLVKVMDSVMEHKGVSIFRSRLESQKRARYKKMIRRHVDLQDLSMKISNGSIISLKELFRDLLLLANNAIVFYPKNSSEHKSAISLRELLNKLLREHCCKCTSGNDGIAASVGVECKPKKPQSLQACSGSKPRSSEVGGKVGGAPTSKSMKKGGRDEAPKASLAKKKAEIDKAPTRETGQKDSLVEAVVESSVKKKATVDGKVAKPESSARKKADVDVKVSKPPALESGNKGGRVHTTIESFARKKSEIGGKVAGALALECVKKGGRSEVLLESPARKKSEVSGKITGTPKLESGKKGGRVEALSESPTIKKTKGRAEKSGKRQWESPGKSRKRARR